MADIKVLIVVNDPEAGKAYGDALSEIGTSYDIAPSFKKMAAMATEAPCNGLIIDILTLVRCSKEEKTIAYDCINLFPVLRIKWDKKLKQINLSPMDEPFATDADAVLKSFIETKCRPFGPRRLRRYKRKQINFNLLLSTDEHFPPETTLKVFTVTSSLGGLFIHTMQDFQPGQTLWVRFVDLKDQTPIPVAVRWSLAWGLSRSIPGIGVSFDRLSQDQERELDALLNFSRPS